MSCGPDLDNAEPNNIGVIALFTILDYAESQETRDIVIFVTLVAIAGIYLVVSSKLILDYLEIPGAVSVADVSLQGLPGGTLAPCFRSRSAAGSSGLAVYGHLLARTPAVVVSSKSLEISPSGTKSCQAMPAHHSRFFHHFSCHAPPASPPITH
ncbi:hypothetical protein HPB50_001800 [Hyalomma asiaticum]|uniref:Uncharacterized protein n=1 Tax=Hyalomma asiaticum TaxID=266040 RepID=A0ACB7RS44_HYAAI|nr:hypothetical protein HPB50_001800 [Hyalomma asiaticum]